MKLINLTLGYVAFVDDEDFAHLSQWNWRALLSFGKVYAVRTQNEPMVAGKRRRSTVLMHRLLLKASGKSVVDHIDGDGLNNQRSNLRLATNAQNGWNRGCTVANSSGFKGVYRSRSRWTARIAANGKRKHLGSFDTPYEASQAYWDAARQLHGEYRPRLVTYA